MIPHIFQKDRRNWSHNELEEIQYFLKCNQFFSKLYDDQQYFSELISMCYYKFIDGQQPLYLRENKRPAAIILLSGNIKVYKCDQGKKAKKLVMKMLMQQQEEKADQHRNSYGKISALDLFGIDKRQKNTQKQGSMPKVPLPQSSDAQFSRPVGQFIGFNQSISISSECKVVSLHNQPSQILFIPSFLYNTFMTHKQQKYQKTLSIILNQIFPTVENRYLKNDLIHQGSIIRNYQINNYIYREGDPINYVYIVYEGSIKLEKNGYGYKNSEVVVVSSMAIFGDTDVFAESREANALCCSSYAKVLEIPKLAFIQFAKMHIPGYKALRANNEKSKTKGSSPTHLKNSESTKRLFIARQKKQRRSSSKLSEQKPEQQFTLPTVFRVHSNRKSKSKQQQEQQYKLIKNSHILLDARPPRDKKIRSTSSYSKYPVDIMEERIKLYQKIRPSPTKLDLTHRLL